MRMILHNLDQFACNIVLIIIIMSRTSTFHSSSSLSYRREPFLVTTTTRITTTRRSSSCCSSFCETAGSTTAECAAVICCFPCGLFNFLLLVMYKIPVGLCRRALRKRERDKIIKNRVVVPKRRKCQCGCDETDVQIHPGNDVGFVKSVMEVDNNEMLKLEMEMWDRFYGTGFWRSHSPRESINHAVDDKTKL